MAQTIVQGTVKAARRRGRHKKGWKYQRMDRTGGLEIPLGRRETEKYGKVLLRCYLWCPEDRRDDEMTKILNLFSKC